MRILVSNDDGYLAPGLAALAGAMRPFGTVTVVAPEQNSSGASNSLTLSRPLTVSTAPDGVIFINGTPSDCVHIALTGLLEQRPDLIVSGINNGQNMGDDTIYSGTVAAAMEGFLFGIPSMAFSLVDKGYEHLDTAAAMATEVVRRHLERPLPGPFLLNVNVPNRPLAEIKGIMATRLGKRHPSEPVVLHAKPSRRADLLDRPGRSRQGRRTGHRLSCHDRGLRFGDAVADRPDAPTATRRRARLAATDVT